MCTTQFQARNHQFFQISAVKMHPLSWPEKTPPSKSTPSKCTELAFSHSKTATDTWPASSVFAGDIRGTTPARWYYILHTFDLISILHAFGSVIYPFCSKHFSPIRNCVGQNMGWKRDEEFAPNFTMRSYSMSAASSTQIARSSHGVHRS